MVEDIEKRVAEGMEVLDLSAPVGMIVLSVERGFELQGHVPPLLHEMLPAGWRLLILRKGTEVRTAGCVELLQAMLDSHNIACRAEAKRQSNTPTEQKEAK